MLNFYSCIIDNEYIKFYDKVYEFEYENYIKTNKINNISINDNKKIYLNILFKIDTIHDFLGSRSSQEILSREEILKYIEWETLFENLRKESIKIPNDFESDIFYWLLVHEKEKTKMYVEKEKTYETIVSTSIENFSDILTNQKDKVNLSIDASEKRIVNFKNLTLFEKHFQNIDFEKISEDEILVENLVKKIKNVDINFKIIFPQLFDANVTTGKSIKWMEKIINVDLHESKSNLLEFNIIKDKCMMKFDKNTDTVIFEIDNKSYNIQKIIISQDYIENMNYDNITKTIYCKNRGPGVNELVEIYKKICKEIDNEISLFGTTGGYIKSKGYLEKILISTSFIEKTEEKMIEKIKEELEFIDKTKIEEKIKEEKEEINKINSDKTIADSIKTKIIRKKERDIKNLQNTYEDKNNTILSILLKNAIVKIETFIKTKESNIKTDKSKINIYKIKNEVLNEYIYSKKSTIANNIFTIKRAGDYSQIYYCSENNFTYVSNDRMSASFSFVENVNFIGSFKDCGMFLNFKNRGIEIPQSIKLDERFELQKCKSISFRSKNNTIKIDKFFKFLYINKKKILKYFDEIFQYEKENSDTKDAKKIIRNMAFKFDTLHDFIGSRSNLKKEKIISVLWPEYDSNNELKTSINSILKINIEENFFYWVIMKDIHESNILQELIFTTTIENFSDCIPNYKSYISIDASDQRITNLKNTLMFQQLKISSGKDKNFLQEKILDAKKYIYEELRIKDDYNVFEFLRKNKDYFFKLMKQKDIDVNEILDIFYYISLLYNLYTKMMYNSEQLLHLFITINYKYLDFIKGLDITHQILSKSDNIILSKACKMMIENKNELTKLIVLKDSFINDLTNTSEDIEKLIKEKNEFETDIQGNNIFTYCEKMITGFCKSVSGIFSSIYNKINYNIYIKNKFKQELKNNLLKSNINDKINEIKKEINENKKEINEKINESVINYDILRYLKKYFKIVNDENIKYLLSENVENEIAVKLLVSLYTTKDIKEYKKVDGFYKLYQNINNEVINEIPIEYNYNIENLIDYTLKELHENDFNLPCYNKIDNELTLYIYNNFFEETNVNFMIIPPQILDANVTTGKSISIKKETISSQIDENGIFCRPNQLLNFLSNFDINLYNQFNINFGVFIDEFVKYIKLKKINAKTNISKLFIYKKNLDVILLELYNKISGIPNKEYVNLIKELMNFEVNNIVNMNVNELNIYEKSFKKNYYNEISFNKNDNSSCNIDVLGDKIINYIYKDKTIYVNEKYETSHICNIVVLEMIDLNYPIQKIKVLNIRDREDINLEILNVIQNNELAKIISDDIKYDFLEKMIDKYRTQSKKNYINILNKKELKNFLIKPLSKDFYYCEKNKTLYCLETGPGVEDLTELYKYFINKNISENYILKNIFTIKRAGDYLQIYYCTKNDYIFISNDRMSATFCFIENCKYIGQIGNIGVFINDKTYEKCLY